MTSNEPTHIPRGPAPLVSVVMNCYNGERYLKEAIDSVFSQSYSNWEIVFWDNASTDRSAAIAQSYDDKRMRYFRGDRNVQLGRARNFALAQCHGDFVAFLDSDDVWLADKLDRQIPLFDSDNDVGLVYSDVLYFNEEHASKRLYSMRTPYRGWCFPNLLADYCLCLSTCVIRKRLLDALDECFDETLNVCEESDLFLRMALRSKIDFVPEALARYRVHDNSWTARDPEAFVLESGFILDKLEGISGVQDEHMKSFQIARRLLARQEAKLAWRQGNGAQARSIILEKLPLGIASVVLFLATVFPFSLLDYIYKRVSGVVRPAR